MSRRISSVASTRKLVCLAFVLFALFANPSFLSTVDAKQPQVKGVKGVKGQVRHRRESRQQSAKGDRAEKSSARAEKRLSPRKRRAAEARRIQARRRAEAARQAAIARQRVLDDSMRSQVQALIVRDDISGEDPEVRSIAINALGNHAGTVVVMDPKTGRIYSIVNQEWAVRRGFKPCSTIKLVTGLAGLNEKIINPSDSVNVSDNNRIDLTKALAYSKNPYFQQVGGLVGFEKMISYASQLGLGEKTGINAPNEFKGQLPPLKSGFALNRMSSHGDDFQVTAVQLATLVSAMANGGKLLAPQIERTTKEEAKFKPKVRRVVNIDLENWAYMVPGMVGAVNYGSGRRANNPVETVAGKTGTCIEQGMWVGLFASYAPLANPRLAVVVIARGTDARGHFPAAVAGRIYRDLNGRFGTPTDLQVATSNSAAPGEDGDEGDDQATAEAEETDEMLGNSGATVISNSPKTDATSSLILPDAAIDQNIRKRTDSPVVTVVANPKPAQKALWTNSRVTGNSKVRRVLMPIPKRNEVTKRTAASKRATKTGSQADREVRTRRPRA